SRGKRLRPLLALLAGGATGTINSGHIDLAVIVELIHIATLVHDDVMDEAERRRAQPTANARWGNSLSILLGDCLFAHALTLSTNSKISDFKSGPPIRFTMTVSILPAQRAPPAKRSEPTCVKVSLRCRC